MKKKYFGAERIGLLPNYIVKIFFFFLLQYSFCIAEKEAWGRNCIARQSLYCNRKAGRLDCIVGLYCKRLAVGRIVSQYNGLYCD